MTSGKWIRLPPPVEGGGRVTKFVQISCWHASESLAKHLQTVFITTTTNQPANSPPIVEWTSIGDILTPIIKLSALVDRSIESPLTRVDAVPRRTACGPGAACECATVSLELIADLFERLCCCRGGSLSL